MSNHVKVESGVVIQSDRTVLPPDGFIAAPEHVVPGYTFDGRNFDLPVPELPTVDDYKTAIVAMLDGTALERRYDTALSIATYVGSTNPSWTAEATAFIAWRDAIWSYAYAELDKVLSGQREQPTIADFLAELPALTWPA